LFYDDNNDDDGHDDNNNNNNRPLNSDDDKQITIYNSVPRNKPMISDRMGKCLFTDADGIVPIRQKCDKERTKKYFEIRGLYNTSATC
jgi:hypothetical protein